MDLTRMSDLAVLLALFYIGLRLMAYGWTQRQAHKALSRPPGFGLFSSGLLLWTLAALHAICHLGGR